MQTLGTAFEAEARKLIERRIEDIHEQIGLGLLPDFAAYKRDAGRIEGLKEVFEIFDDVNKTLQER